MILYHATYDVESACRKLFVPRVPASAADIEDKNIPRICLADSIEHCVQAIQSLPANGDIIQVYKFNIDENDENLIKPQELYDKGLVYDALENNEYWYLKSIEADSKLYEVRGGQMEFAFAWTVIKKDCVIDQALAAIKDCSVKVDDATLEKARNQDTAEKAYNVIMKYFNAQYELNKNDVWCQVEDTFWDYIADLPFAQLKKLLRLSLVDATYDGYLERRKIIEEQNKELEGLQSSMSCFG